jgi:cytochrome c
LRKQLREREEMTERGAGWAVWRVALPALLVVAVPTVSAVAAADPNSGEAAFVQQCGTCHVISPSPSERQGPNLYGVLGRHAGMLKGFKYSKALAKAKFAWDRARLDAWLTDTAKLVPGSLMNYRQTDPALRAAIIDYLEAASAAK